MTDHPSRGLTLHLAERLDCVADALAGMLDGPRADPFATDLVCVPGPGVQRWLAQRLAARLGAVDGDGVCAGIDFASLGQVCDDALAAAGGHDPDDDPWSGDRLVWAVLRAFDASAAEPWFASVSAHLAGGDDARPGRRYGTARRLAGLYRRWLTWRPDDLERWLGGADDGSWQASLWRAVVDQVDGPDPFVRRRAAVAALAADPAAVHLPPELHAVAPGRVPPGVVDAVAALARHRTVHVWLVVPGHGGLGARLGTVRHRQADQWRTVADDVVRLPAPSRPATLLGTLQRQVGDDADLDPVPADGSVAVHVSHGPERQVEVLRDVLVDLLAGDPTLEPRHVVVLTPDLDTYGPLVRARCGLDAADLEPVQGGPAALHPAHTIRVSVADRSLRQANPVLDVLTRVLDLASSRAEVSELLDLCATEPVARRFGFRGAEAVERIGLLLREAGVRWGIDLENRRRFGVQVQQNTWQTGLNRLLLGLTMSERELASLGTALPYDVLESTDATWVGNLAELMGRLRSAADEFSRPATPAVWVERFRRALFGETDDEGMVVGGLVSVPAADAWQVAQAQAQLSAMAEAAGPDAPLLSLGDVKVLVRDRLQGRLPRSALLTGGLTVTSLDALPQVPHRVVVLLGLDDQSFPRPVVARGDDVLGRTPAEGDPALDDRQAFLDAFLAAQQAFVVVYRGRDTRTNDVVPPPIPVRDLVHAARGADADVVVRHSLQPYDVDGFVAGAPASYDAVAARAAAALVEGRRADAPAPRDRTGTDGLPPAERTDEVDLDDLVAFYTNPVKHFRDTRLLTSTWVGTPPSDQIPVELTGLEQWAVKSRLLELRRQGLSREQVEASERLRGTVPPGRLGSAALASILDQVEGTVARIRLLRLGPEADLDLQVPLDGVTVTARLRAADGTVVLPVVGRIRGRHWAALWLRLLVLAAAYPDRAWQGVALNDGRLRRLQPPDDPAGVLGDLVALRWDGLDRVLPLPPDTAFAYAAGLPGREQAETDSRRQWRFERRGWADRFDTWDDLAAAPGPDGDPEFVRLCEQVYGPVVAGGAGA